MFTALHRPECPHIHSLNNLTVQQSSGQITLYIAASLLSGIFANLKGGGRSHPLIVPAYLYSYLPIIAPTPP
jgi:hypothetical protein